MRKLVLVLVGTAVLCVPAVSAAGRPTPAKLATQMCKSLRAQDGRSTFRQAYHSFAGCLRLEKPQSKVDITNSAKSCKTERETDPVAFRAKYGTNAGNAAGAGANAFGKCVSTIAKQNAKSDVANSVDAAKTCKTLQGDLPTFQATYGTGKNAFGKCVAQQAKVSSG
jgi:hypothetical protein